MSDKTRSLATNQLNKLDPWKNQTIEDSWAASLDKLQAEIVRDNNSTKVTAIPRWR